MNKKMEFVRKCVVCKRPIVLMRDSKNEDAVIFLNDVYHRNCFIENNVIVKKCFCCKKDIRIVTVSDLDSVAYYDKHYFHKKCLEDKCLVTKTPKWKNAKKYILDYVEDAKDQLESIASVKFSNLSIDIKHLNEDLNKNLVKKYFAESDVNAFIRETYNMEQIGTELWRRLSAIYRGDYRYGLSKPIPPEDLLDMWKKKLGFLDKVNEKNISLGKGSEDRADRIFYDLAILVNKYDSYLKWKRKQEMNEVVLEDKHKNDIRQDIDLVKMSKHVQVKKETDNDDDIENILDDIFG